MKGGDVDAPVRGIGSYIEKGPCGLCAVYSKTRARNDGTTYALTYCWIDLDIGSQCEVLNDSSEVRRQDGDLVKVRTDIGSIPVDRQHRGNADSDIGRGKT